MPEKEDETTPHLDLLKVDAGTLIHIEGVPFYLAQDAMLLGTKQNVVKGRMVLADSYWGTMPEHLSNGQFASKEQ